MILLQSSKVESIDLVLWVILVLLLRGSGGVATLSLLMRRIVLTLVLCALELQFHAVA